MRIYIDYSEFRKVTGMMAHAEELRHAGIDACTALGFFSSDRLDEIVEFCTENPKYHVISIKDFCTMVNRASTDARLYVLATGDKSEDIIFDERLDGTYVTL